MASAYPYRSATRILTSTYSILMNNSKLPLYIIVNKGDGLFGASHESRLKGATRATSRNPILQHPPLSHGSLRDAAAAARVRIQEVAEEDDLQ